MHIGVCDDDSLELVKISALLNAYRQEKSISLTYQTFQSGMELCSTLRAAEYDALLLDVLMPGMSGMQAAHEIRGVDAEVALLFLTASPEYALESYEVKAADYILKPISRERLFDALDAVAAREARPPEGFAVKAQGGAAKILYSRLAFVEVLQKRLYFHLTDGSVRIVCAPLAEFEGRLLARPEFIKTHRSYIANLYQMSDLRADSLLAYTGESIPISRLLYPKVRQAYLEHLFVEKEAE